MKAIMLKSQGMLLRLPGDDNFSELPDGEYDVEIKRPRNAKFHRKFFAFLNLVFSNQDKYDNIDDLRWELLLRCGYYHAHATLNGEMLYFPKSIAFDKMDEVEFEALYKKITDVVFKYFINGTAEDEQKFLNQVATFL